MKMTWMPSAACVTLLMAGSAMAAQKAGDADKGKEVFEQCGVCHNIDSPDKKVGPSLQGLYKKPKLKNGKAVTDANVKAIINTGGNGMPAYADMLSDDERADLIAYLKTI
jgi:cytochrome c2